MKRYKLFLIICIVCISCRDNSSADSLSKDQWNSVLQEAFLFTGILDASKNIYCKYANEEVLDSLKAFYYYGSSVVGYDFNDSVSFSIEELQNSPINTKIGELSGTGIKLISDTSKIEESYFMISAPVFSGDKIMLALGWSESRDIKRKWWIFYYQRKLQEIELVSIYDFQKDDFYFKGKP